MVTGNIDFLYRIDHFLNLNATSSQDAELYQVANYGLAGQYTSHYDQVIVKMSSPGPKAKLISDFKAYPNLSVIKPFQLLPRGIKS